MRATFPLATKNFNAGCIQTVSKKSSSLNSLMSMNIIIINNIQAKEIGIKTNDIAEILKYYCDY